MNGTPESSRIFDLSGQKSCDECYKVISKAKTPEIDGPGRFVL